MRGTLSDSEPEDSAAAALDIVVKCRFAEGAGIETSKAVAMLKQRARFIERFPTWTELSQTSRRRILDGQRRRKAHSGAADHRRRNLATAQSNTGRHPGLSHLSRAEAGEEFG